MTKSLTLLALLACLALPTHAADYATRNASLKPTGPQYYFTYRELMADKDVIEVLDPAVTLYWRSQPTPELAERSKLEIYSSGVTNAFGGAKRHCIAAFTAVLTELINDARRRGYDSIVDIHQTPNSGDTEALITGPDGSAPGIGCSPSFRTRISLESSFAMTPAAAKFAQDKEAALLANPVMRAPAPKAVFMPLDAALNTPEAKAVLQPMKVVHAGLRNTPAFKYRYGPEAYSESASVRKLGSPEAACNQAVVNALRAAMDDAKDKGFDSLMRIRSFLNDRLTPIDTDFECEVGSSSASVNLLVTLMDAQ